jgi:hypothetical protein
MLKVSPWKCVARFRKKGKLAPRYVRPFVILQRIGLVAYRLQLPQELSNLPKLRKTGTKKTDYPFSFSEDTIYAEVARY